MPVPSVQDDGLANAPSVRRGGPDAMLNAGNVAGLALDRADAMLPADLIHDDEVIILLLRPHPLFVILSSLQSTLILVIVTLILAYLPRIPWIGWTDGQAFAFGTTLIFLRLVWQTLEWTNRVYVLTDRRLIRRMGVLRVAVFETPLSRIQHTSVFTRVRERLFGLGTIGFATAGSDVYEAFWSMISNPFAVHKMVVEAMDRYGRR